MALRVNGVEITEERIRDEMQYHPAPSPDDARREAVNALVVRTLLLSEAWRLGIAAPPPLTDATKKLIEAPEEALIRALVDREIVVAEPSEDDCRAYYLENPQRFKSPDLLQAAHILFSAEPNDRESMAKAKARAEAALKQLRDDPARFGELAREHSDCSSREHGGDLGQITRGSTIPEFETFLFALEPGQICPVPIRTRYGYHVVRLNQRLIGRQLPYESVNDRIKAYLREKTWREAVHNYIGRLKATAIIEETAEPADREFSGCGPPRGCGAAPRVPPNFGVEPT